jgi:hypothetical protein
MTGRQRDDGLLALVVGLAAGAWWWRLELALLAAAAGVWWLLARALGSAAGAVGVVVLVAVVLASAAARRLLWRALRQAWVRRAWASATVDVGLADGPLRVPRVVRIPAGQLMRVRVRRGQSVAALADRADELGACLRLRELRVEPDQADAAIARVTLVRRDPFEQAEPIAWPALDAESLSLWEPVPVGVDEYGEPVAIRLVERNVLVGGEPGAGKSVALSLLVAAAAMDRDARDGCWTASWSSSPAGPRSASASWARTASRRSASCASCKP